MIESLWGKWAARACPRAQIGQELGVGGHGEEVLGSGEQKARLGTWPCVSGMVWPWPLFPTRIPPPFACLCNGHGDTPFSGL